MARVALKLSDVNKRFGTFEALKRIELSIDEGEFLTIVGPSGSGKTTLIRLLVGMDDPTSGTIELQGRTMNGVPANQRPTCMVFQSLALFPHRTVGENIEFPLKIRKVAAAERKVRALALLNLLRLPEHYYDRKVTQCSGGERQRVALARALCFDPEILFFDEPLSALDYRLRKTLEKELKNLHRQTGKTFVYITHSLEEAMVMSDRIAIMNQGKVAQVGTADDIYSRPNSKFVANFMGEVNLFDLQDSPDGIVWQNKALKAIDVRLRLAEGENACLMIRPEFIRFLSPSDTADFIVQATLIDEYALGSRFQYAVELDDGKRVVVERLREDRCTSLPDEKVYIGWDSENTHLIRQSEFAESPVLSPVTGGGS